MSNSRRLGVGVESAMLTLLPVDDIADRVRRRRDNMSDSSGGH
jgi:hypothetical protein